MKIRIKGNSVRLRLTKVEVDSFAKEGWIKDHINFGLSPKQKLVYSLQKWEGDQLSARYHPNEIQILVPHQLAKDWAESEQVGMDEVLKFDEKDELKILVEKDFQCLNVRPDEDESDNYPNPNAQ